jgi:photosystem II stability/assembly factor-like uncharacterized protein
MPSSNSLGLRHFRARRLNEKLDSRPTLLTQVCLIQAALLACLTACGDGDQTALARWNLVAQSADSALLSIGGTAANDVWAVGADAGDGPLVLHWDGAAWARVETGVNGDLWWVHALPDGSLYMSGSDALVLRYRNGAFERMDTPGLGKSIVFGVWASSDTDVYAVGSEQGRNGFIWHYDGVAWASLPLPVEAPVDANRDVPSFFKVWGASGRDVWVVGDRGVVLRGNASDGFRSIASGASDRLFTVHGNGELVAMVGGAGNGWALEAHEEGLLPITPPGSSSLQGVCVSEKGTIWAVGGGGAIYRRDGSEPAWQEVIVDTPVQSLHSVWVDPSEGVWSVGGNVLTNDLDAGVVLHAGLGSSVAQYEVPPRGLPVAPVCPDAAIDPAPDASIARRWNEQLLNAIRRDVPRPTVHARNLLHTSLAMWDAWAAYDATADGYVVAERRSDPDPRAAREAAISYAAYRVLSHRYASAVGGALSQACFDAFMRELGNDPSDASEAGDSARALGNRIGAAVIARFAADGANEGDDYADPADYEPSVPRLVVDLPGTVVDDPTRWQPLVLAEAVTQNGIALGSGAQGYIGSQWGDVLPFALVRSAPGQPFFDTGRAPTALDDQLVDAAVDVLRKAAELDIEDDVRWDISPGAYGNNPLGTNDGRGHPQNPVTGQPYTPERVLRGDFARVLAEYWADGPASETPPGHWNTIANGVSYDARFERRLFGSGEPLDPLAWDVHLYLALNAAEHDAAIAAWELKRVYGSARPITLIRYMGGLGQRSQPDGPSHHPRGLPLVEGLIEVITPESSAPGARHAHLARYVGEIAVRSWPGEPGDRVRQVARVTWIRAKDWVPYQRRFFVTPAFPGYVSGHSTFSRAGAVVLHRMTGSAYFPGGLGQARFEPGYLVFEAGPSQPIELQWASYYDAADQAGQSRLWGGIHIRHDDFDGRRIGAEVGERAVVVAQRYFTGSAR